MFQTTISDNAISDIVHIIQLAIAPVFLLVGIASLLNVFTGRLARIIDRVRQLERDVPIAGDDERQMELKELATLDRRVKLCQSAISMCTMAAILVCITVIVLFVASIATLDFTVPVAWLFIAVMTALTLGVTFFFIEVTVSIASVRVRKEYVRAGREGRDIFVSPSLDEIAHGEAVDNPPVQGGPTIRKASQKWKRPAKNEKGSPDPQVRQSPYMVSGRMLQPGSIWKGLAFHLPNEQNRPHCLTMRHRITSFRLLKTARI